MFYVFVIFFFFFYVCFFFFFFFFFFFQAEDGIRDFHVTGVQTCALPIYGVIRVRDLAPEQTAGLVYTRDGLEYPLTLSGIGVYDEASRLLRSEVSYPDHAVSIKAWVPGAVDARDRKSVVEGEGVGAGGVG